MKTWEDINNAFKFLPALVSLNKLKNKKHSNADLQLIGSIINDDYTAPFLIEFDDTTKKITIGRDYDPKTERYYTVSCFKVPDAFQGN